MAMATLLVGVAGPLNGALERTVPTDIEERIATAFEHAVATGDPSALGGLGRSLDLPPSPVQRYWKGLLHYRLATVLIAAGDLVAAEAAIGTAVAALESIEPHDSESRALHALAAGMALGFTPPERMFAAVGPVIESLIEALRLDPANPRAHYANAMADYQTPRHQGGGERVDEFLAKALAGFAAADGIAGDPGTPTWGHEDAIALALSHYQRENRAAAATALRAMAKKRFPASAVLARVDSEM